MNNGTSNRQRVQHNDYSIDPPIEFNPSLYPTKKRRVGSSSSPSPFSNSYPTSNSVATSHCNNSRRNMNRARKGRTTISKSAIAAMFDSIADENDPNIANMEGVCKLAEKLNIDPFEDVRILVLLYKLGAEEKPSQMSREEWKIGCERLQCDSTDKFKDLLPSLDTAFMVDNEFRNFYKFSFQFNRQGTYKTLAKDLVTELIQMILKERASITGERLSTFVEFLNQTTDVSYDRITLDQWMSFYDFSIECTDLKDYDEETSAWPVLIDDYVDFATSMQK